MDNFSVVVAEAKNQLFRKSVMIIWGIMISYLGVCFYYHLVAATVFILSTFVTIPLVLWFSRKGFKNSSRGLFLVVVNTVILAATLGVREESGGQYYFVALSALPFIIFDGDEPWMRVYGLSVTTLCWCVFNFSGRSHFPDSWYPVDPPVDLFRFLAFGGSLAGLSAAVSAFARTSARIQQKAVESIDTEKQSLQTTLNTMSEGLIVHDSRGRVIRFNPAALQIFGLPAHELMGRTPMDPRWISVRENGATLPGEDHPALVALKTRLPQRNVTLGLRISAAQMKWVQLHAVPVPAIDGDWSVTVTYTDITMQFQAQRQIESDRQHLLQSAKMAALGEMAGGVAHEINNPLAIILGRSEQIKGRILRNDFNPERILTDLEKMNSTVGRITRIVKGLQAFSRNADNDPFQDVLIGGMVQDTLDLCAEKFRNINIEVRVDVSVDIVVLGRLAQLEQVLMNLLSNSYDAIATLEQRWIQIDALSDQGWVEISVQDSGVEIKAAIAEKIMQPFFTTKVVGKGTGLGLSISKGIIESHGGTLTYQPKGGHTRFVIRLPSAVSRSRAS